jgi:AbiU2
MSGEKCQIVGADLVKKQFPSQGKRARISKNMSGGYSKERVMAKRKTTQEQIAAMSTAERVELAKKLTDRVTDHLLYVLELHETNRIVLYSPILSSQIPTSHAGNAFITFQRGLHQIEIVRLCALWDSVDLQKENIPTVIDLIDHPEVIDVLAKEISCIQLSDKTSRLHPRHVVPNPETRAAALDAIRGSEQEFGQQQASLLRRELSIAIAETRAVLASSTHASIMNLRDKHLAHSLIESRRERKVGPVDPLKCGDERVVLDASLRIARALMGWVKGASFDFEDSRKIDRANAEALWKQCTFDIKW